MQTPNNELDRLIESAAPLVDVHLRLRNAANSRDYWHAQALLWGDKCHAARQWNRVAFCVIVLLLVVIAGLWEGK